MVSEAERSVTHLISAADSPNPLIAIGRASPEELAPLSRALGLGLHQYPGYIEDVHNHFKRLGRPATLLELKAIDTGRNSHSYHMEFKDPIEYTENGRTHRIDSLLSECIWDLPQPEWVLSRKGNAGLVDFYGTWAIAIKVESHNRPSYVVPPGGAGTGVGGDIRDVLAMQSLKPFVLSDSLCFPEHDATNIPDWARHPLYLEGGVVAGIRDYGNNVGIPNLAGSVTYDSGWPGMDSGYVGNIVVWAGAAGLVPIDAWKRGVNKTRPGDVAILVGPPRGRDGIGGVTFASKGFGKDIDKLMSAVQVPQPIEKEKLMRGHVEVVRHKKATGTQDLGGGGIWTAASETAYDRGLAMKLDLGVVPLRQRGLAPWEKLISESQEGFLYTARPADAEWICGVFADEGLPAAVIGRYLKGRVMRIYDGQDNTRQLVGELDLKWLYSPPQTVWKAVWNTPSLKEPEFEEPADYNDVMLRMLARPNIASREPILRQYDHNVQGRTVTNPLQGEYGWWGPGDGTVVRPLAKTWQGAVLSVGLCPRYQRIDPAAAAEAATSEAVCNNAVAGGRRLAVLNNTTHGDYADPAVMGEVVRNFKGWRHAKNLFEVHQVGGKDSGRNKSPAGNILGTFHVTALGIIPDVRQAMTMPLKHRDHGLYVIGETAPELGGSEYYRMRGHLGASVPRLRDDAPNRVKALLAAIDRGQVVAAHDISDGGLAVAAAEMAFAGNRGVDIYANRIPSSCSRLDHVLFSESMSRFLVEVRNPREFDSLMRRSGVTAAKIGSTRGRGDKFTILSGNKVIDLGLRDMREAWSSYIR